jgi:hypothetical protein
VRDRPEEELLLVGRPLGGQQLCAREDVLVARIGNELETELVAEVPCGHPQVQQGRAAADHKGAVVGVDDRERPRPVRVEVEGVAVQVE